MLQEILVACLLVSAGNALPAKLGPKTQPELIDENLIILDTTVDDSSSHEEAFGSFIIPAGGLSLPERDEPAVVDKIIEIGFPEADLREDVEDEQFVDIPVEDLPQISHPALSRSYLPDRSNLFDAPNEALENFSQSEGPNETSENFSQSGGPNESLENFSQSEGPNETSENFSENGGFSIIPLSEPESISQEEFTQTIIKPADHTKLPEKLPERSAPIPEQQMEDIKPVEHFELPTQVRKEIPIITRLYDFPDEPIPAFSENNEILNKENKRKEIPIITRLYDFPDEPIPAFSENNEILNKENKKPSSIVSQDPEEPIDASDSERRDVIIPKIETEKKMVGMPFKYDWGVSDRENGNDFAQEAFSDGRVTQGQYHVLLPDGRYQIVRYRDDGSGYQAEISFADTL